MVRRASIDWMQSMVNSSDGIGWIMRTDALDPCGQLLPLTESIKVDPWKTTKAHIAIHLRLILNCQRKAFCFFFFCFVFFFFFFFFFVLQVLKMRREEKRWDFLIFRSSILVYLNVGRNETKRKTGRHRGRTRAVGWLVPSCLSQLEAEKPVKEEEKQNNRNIHSPFWPYLSISFFFSSFSTWFWLQSSLVFIPSKSWKRARDWHSHFDVHLKAEYQL